MAAAAAATKVITYKTRPNDNSWLFPDCSRRAGKDSSIYCLYCSSMVVALH